MINIRDDYEDELKKYIHGSSGTIRFGIHPRRTLYLLSSSARFSARYPDVELIPYEASSERMVELLLNGELDFAIINLTSIIALEYHLLYEDYMVSGCSCRSPVCKNGPLPLMMILY